MIRLRPLLLCLEPLVVRQCKGRAFELATADNAPDTKIGGFSFSQVLQAKESRRADLRTAYPCSSYE